MRVFSAMKSASALPLVPLLASLATTSVAAQDFTTLLQPEQIAAPASGPVASRLDRITTAVPWPRGLCFVDGKLVVRDLTDGSVLATVRAHTEKLDALDFSRDGAFLVTGGWDNTAQVWSTAPLRQPTSMLTQQVQDRWGTDITTVLRDRQ